jgi:Primase C terminal 2 (PriCT-2)
VWAGSSSPTVSTRTGQPYVWPEESLVDLPLENLPVVDEQQAHAFLEQAYERIPEALRPKTLAATPGPAAGERARAEPCGTPDAIAAALAFVPNADLDYDSWIRIGMALKGALGEDGRELFEDWSAQSHKDVPETTVRQA